MRGPEPTGWGEIRRQVLERDKFHCLSCGIAVTSAEADVHHLLPRSMGGTDDLSNLVTLCDGCHASHHPTLAGRLARRVIEKWAIRLARWLDRDGVVAEEAGNFGPALRLFGVERFRSGQLPIVLAALAGKSILVISPTGSGKTLCFQLPALLRPGLSMVVSPLKTLMSAQVSTLLGQKIPATFINSDLSSDEKETRFKLLARHAIKLLYLAPERFFVRSEIERAQLKRDPPAFLVIDEAHCVDRWGNDFRPEYGRLDEVRQKLGSPPVLAFTATAGAEMQQRILRSLGIPQATVFVRDVDRPNIALIRRRCPPEERPGVIAELLGMPVLRGGKTMVFVPSTKVGDDLRSRLSAMGLDIPFFHSRLGTSWERQELLQRFLGKSRPEVDAIICTNAFGMGLDLPNVRLTVHWQQSASMEDLLQEFGRAGRDGRQSATVIFHDGRSSGDTGRLKFMAEKTVEAAALDSVVATAMLEQRHAQIDQAAHLLRADTCFRQSVRSYFGQSNQRRRRSLSEVILDWVFGTAASAHRGSACCDHCDREQLNRLGFRDYVATVLGGVRPPSRMSPPSNAP